MTEKIVVLGGGAGGLELVVKLARKFKKDSSVEIILIDRNPTHIWKPLLHEVATGTLNSHFDETSYLMLARKFKFSFVLGSAVSIEADKKCVNIAPSLDDSGEEILAARSIDYSTLVLSVGSLCNDFGTQGVVEHSLLLDTREQAERFHQQFINELHRLQSKNDSGSTLSTVIVGAGATGVELAADLHNVAKRLPCGDNKIR